MLRKRLGLILVLALAACKPPVPQDVPATPTPAPHPNPVKIGVFLPLSGAQSSFGSDAIDGAKLAESEINAAGGLLGRPLELLVRDTRSDVETTREVVKELIGQVPVLVGEIASPRSLEAAHIAQELGCPMISPASTHHDLTAIGDFIFRACYADPYQGIAMAQFARSMEAGRAAIIREEGNPYSDGLADSFRAEFLADGGQIVDEETFKAGDLTFRTQLQAVRAAKPEVVFLPSYYVEAAIVIREARQMGLDMPFLGGDGWDSQEFLRVAGSAANNSYSANHFSPDDPSEVDAAFLAAFQKKFHRPPPPLSALTYDAVRLAADAIGRAGEDAPLAVKEALALTVDFHGATGTMDLSGDRTPDKPAVILRVEDGKFTYLETVEVPRKSP